MAFYAFKCIRYGLVDQVSHTVIAVYVQSSVLFVIMRQIVSFPHLRSREIERRLFKLLHRFTFLL